MLGTIRRYGVVDKRVLAAMASTDRGEYVAGSAYADQPVPIGFGQTASQPYTVARMIELAIQDVPLANAPFDPRKAKVLEVGTGSGWQTAVLAKLFKQVYSVEKIPQLAQLAKEALSRSAVTNVEIKVGDGKLGWPEHAPYAAIIVSADANRVPGDLVNQLAEKGRIVIPVRGEMRRGIKTNSRMRWESFGAFTFVPLR